MYLNWVLLVFKYKYTEGWEEKPSENTLACKCASSHFLLSLSKKWNDWAIGKPYAIYILKINKGIHIHQIPRKVQEIKELLQFNYSSYCIVTEISNRYPNIQWLTCHKVLLGVFSTWYFDKANHLTEGCVKHSVNLQYSSCTKTSTKEKRWEEGTDMGERKAAYSLTTHLLQLLAISNEMR